MCRGPRLAVCSLLGADPAKWNRFSPLPPPAWFHDAIRSFERAVALASSGSLAESRDALAAVREPELREFFEEHGQQTYRFRTMGRGIERLAPGVRDLDPVRAISGDLQREVMARDGYLCRYCQIPVVPKSVLAAYAKVIGADAFPTANSNAGRHGVVLAFRANVDHVLPHNRGGRTNLDNLVTSCWSCNYGKSRFTVDELGLDDPRNRAPRQLDGWLGLTQYIEPLRRAASGTP